MEQECVKESKAITLSRQVGNKKYSYILHIGGIKSDGTNYSNAVYIYKLIEKDVYNDNTIEAKLLRLSENNSMQYKYNNGNLDKVRVKLMYPRTDFNVSFVRKTIDNIDYSYVLVLGGKCGSINTYTTAENMFYSTIPEVFSIDDEGNVYNKSLQELYTYQLIKGEDWTPYDKVDDNMPYLLSQHFQLSEAVDKATSASNGKYICFTNGRYMYEQNQSYK